ncbi:MAG: hypothetical protein J6A04_04765 [Clostridia bacterium]|nr:hypothetical protein [Clostridia bacterium]
MAMECNPNPGIRRYGGTKSEPIFDPPENHSTFYDYLTDTQCTVPLEGAEELRKELGMK